MTMLLEKPLFIVFLGVSTAALLGAIWIQTGRRAVMHALVAVLAITAALVLIERMVETDREQLEATLHAIAREVERNDLDAVLAYAHPEAESIRREASAELPRYVFQRVSVKPNLDIEIAADKEPPEAKVKFNVVVDLSEKGGGFRDMRIPRFVVVTFWKEGDDWLAIDYEHHQPQQGYMRKK